ncbi:hypothetical protein INT48_005666 [Thamnidium elegans]|uniref:Transposase n=1 Tax=Thamnidium elegans TaxID=101142 RepID=A0A8H7VRE9_9FUNG|nr:hypothetical protein INT48_005666 [Thamnidium elegans]
MSTRNAALQLGINPSTAQTWVKKEQDEQDARVYRQTEERAAESSSSHSSSSPRTSAELSPVQLSPMNATQKYKKYTSQDKENLLYLIRERGMNTRSAALQLGINPSTAQTWVKREQDTRLYPQTEERAADPDNHATGYASESEGELESPVTPQRTIEQQSPMNATHTYKHYTPQDKESLFYLIREKGMSTTAAATQLGINPSTVQSWVRKERDYAKETGQTSKLLEKQLDREESIEKNIPFVNTSNHGQQEDRRSATPQVVPNSVEPTATKQTRTYKKYTPQDKENLFHLVREKGMSTTAAATQLDINPSTAQSWVRKDRENPQPVPVQTHHTDPSPVPVPVQTTDQYVSEKEDYEQSVPESVKAKRTYKKYTAQDKENLFHLVKDTSMSTRGAAMQLGINPSTAQSWVKKDREETAALSEEQEEFLTTKISEQGVLTLDEMLESLNIEFKGLDVSKTALCNFAMKKYTICFTL